MRACNFSHGDVINDVAGYVRGELLNRYQYANDMAKKASRDHRATKTSYSELFARKMILSACEETLKSLENFLKNAIVSAIRSTGDSHLPRVPLHGAKYTRTCVHVNVTFGDKLSQTLSFNILPTSSVSHEINNHDRIIDRLNSPRRVDKRATTTTSRN